MKLKYVLLVLVIVVMIPEILLISYVLGKYSLSIEISQLNAGDFFSFLILNPMFSVVVLAVFIMLFVLYFALQAK